MTAMAVSNLQVLDIIEVMEAFLERNRPPEHIDRSWILDTRSRAKVLSSTRFVPFGTTLQRLFIRKLLRQLL